MMDAMTRYTEAGDTGNGYRNQYHQGLDALLQQLQTRAEVQRQTVHKELRTNPERVREKIRQCLGWQLTQPRKTDERVKRQFVTSDELADIYRLQLEIQPGLWM